MQVTAPLFSSRLYEHGQKAGDQLVPEQIDVGQKFDLTVPLVFYEKEYSTVYVSLLCCVYIDGNLTPKCYTL
jgi:hypothetical protein